MSSIRGAAPVVAGLLCCLLLAGCGSAGSSGGVAVGAGPAAGAVGTAVAVPAPSGGSGTAGPSASRSATASAGAGGAAKPKQSAAVLPRAGNPGGGAAVPAAARAVDSSHPDRVIGHGTAASCTSAAVVAAVAAGGVITFSCGPDPVVITMTATAKVRNASARVVLDGGGKVTLSGGGQRRILYQDTCDQAQGWTTSHCQDQSTPQLTVQNLTFADGNSTGDTAEGGGCQRRRFSPTSGGCCRRNSPP
ncbi:hypothetical protein [Streptacidiphilus cavernicola]|uniref:Ricin B lectin domain-containing protein n=1 Tax=Streptacidiphilus cavernicola TaxID=3342716 RepID=A0ABV6W086_9ACTN